MLILLSCPNYRYPEDPDLTFDTLPTHTFDMPSLYEEDKKAQANAIAALELTKEALGNSIAIADLTSDFIDKRADDCDLLGRNAIPSITTFVAAGNGGGGVSFPVALFLCLYS